MMRDHWINTRHSLILLCCAAISGCDSGPITPAQYEQAKADCAPHGGLASAQLMYMTTRPNRVDATCQNGVLILRYAVPSSTQEATHG